MLSLLIHQRLPIMTLKFIFCLLIGLCSTYHSYAWTELSGNIRGIVTNQESGQVVRGATLRLIPFTSGSRYDISKTYSQDGGEYIFANVTPGIYNLECSAFGYKTTRLIGLQIREDRTKLAYPKMQRGPTAEVNEIFSYASLEAQQLLKTQTTAATEESLGNAPATVYIITAENIKKRGYFGLNDVLQDIPEFQIQYYHSPEEFNMTSARGIYGNEKLLVLINGHRYNSMNSSKYSLMENYNIRFAERIEIIIGPASALYGADAYMGVINVITKRGNKVKGVGTTLGYGMYNTLQLGLELGGGNEKSAAGLQMSYFRTNGPDLQNLYPSDFYWYNQHYSQTGAMLSSTKPGSGTQTINIEPFFVGRQTFHLAGQFSYKKFNASVTFNGDLHSSATGNNPAYSVYQQGARYGTIFTNINLEQQYLFKKNNKLTAKTLFDASLYALSRTSNFNYVFSSYRNAYKAAFDGGIRITHTFNYTFNPKHRLTVGMYAQAGGTLPLTASLPNEPQSLYTPLNPINTAEADIYYLGTAHASSDTSYKIPQQFYYLRRLVAGTFVEYKAQLWKPLYLTIGLRYDHIFDINLYPHDSTTQKIRSYLNIGPKIGLVYRPWKNWTFKLSFGQGFLQPPPEIKYRQSGTFTFNKDDNTFSAGFWCLPNPDLLPERVQTIELSARYSKGDFTISSNGYFNRLLNAWTTEQRRDSTSFGGVTITDWERTINQSIPQYYYGATVFLAYRMVWGAEEQFNIQLNTSYSYNNGTLSNLQQLPFTAQHSAKAGILFELYNFSWYNSLLYRSTTYGRETFDTDGNTTVNKSAPLFLWNSFLRYQILNKDKIQLACFVKIQNVLNSRYYHPSSNSIISLGSSPQNPLIIMGGVSAKFGRKTS